jgi:hypothetical protein
MDRAWRVQWVGGNGGNAAARASGVHSIPFSVGSFGFLLP